MSQSSSSDESDTTADALSQQWIAHFEEVVDRLGPLFPRSDARGHCRAYLRGLLAPVERKNGWQLAEAVGDATPYALQHLLGRAKWDADSARDELRSYVVDSLGDPNAVLALDETGFLKKGDKSVGVQRQYSGTAGRIENCQVGVFLAYVSKYGRTFIDRALYLPQSWVDSPSRREQVGIPAEQTFQTKPQIGVDMLERARCAQVPFSWVTGDEVYGNDSRIRNWCVANKKGYVLAVSCKQSVFVRLERHTVRELLDNLSPGDWQRLSAGKGSKGPRKYDWALWPFSGGLSPEWGHAILFRRSVSEPKNVAYFMVMAPPNTSLQTLVQVAGSRWAIEESFETAKGEVGLDQYEVRSWHGWNRHITLSLWAHAFLTVLRAQAASGKKIKREPKHGAVDGS